MIFLLIWFFTTTLSLLFIRWVNKNNLIPGFKNAVAILVMMSFIPVIGIIVVLICFIMDYFEDSDGNIKILNWFKGE